MPLSRILGAALISLMVAGCAGDGGGPSKEEAGSVLGAILGAWAGSKIGSGSGKVMATATGAVLGSWAGASLGRSLEKADRAALEKATQSALETGRSGEATEWANPDSGISGSVTPQPAFEAEDGEHCREFQQSVSLEGESQTAYGTACRQADGTWKVVTS